MSLFPEGLIERAEALLAEARKKGRTIATAESCTGGLIAALLTEIGGSSDVMERGFVTYSNAAKSEMLSVPAELIGRMGAVSPEVARAMAEGALAHSSAALCIAVTGIAGPGGATAAKPVGLVEFACAERSGETVLRTERFGAIGRSAVRLEAVTTAIKMLEQKLGIA